MQEGPPVRLSRAGTVTSAAALAAVLALAPTAAAPAHADVIPAPPPPVSEIPLLPSQAVKSLTGSAVGDSIVPDMLRAQDTLIKIARTTPAAVKPPVPISAPVTVTRGAAAGSGALVTLSFAAGWAITDGTLALYAATTGNDNPLDQACGTWLQGPVQVLYPISSPDCSATVVKPNEDAPMDWQPAVYPGATMPAFQGSAVVGGSTVYACYSSPGVAPAGTSWQYDNGGGGDGFVGSWTPASANVNCTRIGKVGTGYASWAASLGARVPLRLVGPGGVLAQETVTGTNPTRTASCRIGWEDGTTTTGTGATYQETTGVPMTATGLGCEQAFVSKPGAGPDLMPSSIDVESDDGTSKTAISHSTVPDFTATERKALDPTAGNGHGLVLERTQDGQWLSCNTWKADCAGWWTASSEGTVTDAYRCTYAGEAVDLTECGPYRATFDTQTSTPAITDPVTGEQTDWATDADPGNSTDPAAGPTPGQACMDSWSSAPNPIEWVLTPIKCAFVWGFVPRSGKGREAGDKIRGSFDTSIIGAVAASAGAIAGAFTGSPGCAGLPIVINAFGFHYADTLFAACTQPMAGIAATIRGILTGLVYIGGLFALVRYLGSVFGFVGFGAGGTAQQSGVRFRDSDGQ